MRHVLAGLSVLLLSGAGWLVFYATLSRERESFLTPELMKDFDAQEVKPVPGAPAVSAGLGTSGAGARSGFSEAPSPRVPTAPLKDAVASPAAGAAGHKLFQGLISSPVEFMVRQTHLGRPERFRAFVRDPRRVGRYLSHPLIRGVLDRPGLVRLLLSRPAVIQGFIASPAMQDGRAVAALAQSPLLKQLGQSLGVQAVLEDPAFVRQLVMNPQLMNWIARNPQAAGALSQFGPAMARATSP